jgi:hypothetical protein
MKVHIFFPLLVFFGFLFACSTSPYLKTTDLPDNVKYYSEDKQFNLKPDWYWRLRPGKESVNETIEDKYGYLACIPIVNYGYAFAKRKPEKAVIGNKYITNKSGDGTVVGEIVQDDEMFFIVKWNDYGYFFIKKKDYDFALEFEKYKISNDFINEYKSQKLGAIATYNYIGISDGPKLVNDGQITQYRDSYGNYSNSFMQLRSNSLFLKFYNSKDNGMHTLYNWRSSMFIYIYLKQYQYTNNMGQVFICDIYTPVYIAAIWGDEQWYSFPCDWYTALPENKSVRKRNNQGTK